MKRNKWEIISAVGIMVMCVGAIISILSDIHPWTKGLEDVFFIPWIAFWSYMYGRSDGKRKEFIHHMEYPYSWVKDVKMEELKRLSHIVRQRTTIRFKEEDE